MAQHLLYSLLAEVLLLKGTPHSKRLAARCQAAQVCVCVCACARGLPSSLTVLPCMHAHKGVCKKACSHTHARTRACLRHASPYALACMQMHVYTRVYTQVCVHTHRNMHAHALSPARTRTHTLPHAHPPICTRLHTHTISVSGGWREMAQQLRHTQDEREGGRETKARTRATPRAALRAERVGL